MRKIFICILFGICAKVYGQYPIQLQTIVAPPFTPYLGDYMSIPNKITIIVKNTSSVNQSIVFAFGIESSNGSKISTKINLAQATPFLIGANQTRVVNTITPELKQYFSSSNLVFTNLDNSFASMSVLPEGDYTFCLIAWDKNTGIALSEKSCTDISISYVDPPLIVQPICGDDIPPMCVQNINFIWMPPATSPVDISYEFTLKQIPLNYNIGRGRSNNLNPNDVIRSSEYPILYTQRLTTNSLNYNFRFPKLENGKSYVWRVQAIAKNNKITLKQNGYSEACVFNYIKDNMEENSDTITIKPNSTNAASKSIANTVPHKIELTYPANKQVITWNLPENGTSGYHEFKWVNLPDTNLYYLLEIVKMSSKDEDPNGAIKSKTLLEIPKNAVKHAPIKLHKQLTESGDVGGTYAWRIVAYDMKWGGQKLYESDVRVFYTLPINFGK